MQKKMTQKIRVIELFAGVGGFRLGLEGQKPSTKTPFQVVWSNQWEPSTRQQHASEVYTKRWGSEHHSNDDIAQISIDDIPDHDMLVGGFPCQDYSVARTLNQATGLIGKKGVLWWEIYRILKEKKKKAPDFLLLENVDRLLKSPAKQRGRDFAIMLSSLSDLGYIVEWRVINAADYGMPQRRRRVFLMGYKKDTSLYKKIIKIKDPTQWVTTDGTMALAFPTKESIDNPIRPESVFKITGDVYEVSRHFHGTASSSPFDNAGIVINRKVYTLKVTPKYSGKKATLADIILDEKSVPKDFFIDDKSVSKWKYLKGAKKELRKSLSGHEYHYSEGAMVFPDALDNASRTIVTGEGGATPSRFKHVIEQNGKYRRLTPVELERLNMFPDDHTKGVPDARRAFFMGNALVVGVVKRLGKALISQIEES